MVDYYQQPVDPIRNLQKLIAVIVCIAIGLWLLVMLLGYLTKGALVVNTNNTKDTVTVTQLVSYQQSIGRALEPASKQLVSGAKVRLKPGTYTVSVTGGSLSAQQVVHISARHTVRVTVNPDQTSVLEPVSDRAADNLFATPTELLYTDVTNGNLYSVDSASDEHLLDGSHNFTTVRWADPSFGVAQDSSNHLYSVINGVVAPLAVPFTYSGQTTVVYDVARNHELYIAANHELYAGTVTGGFKKIFTVEKQVSSVVASVNNTVALYEGGDNDSADAGDNASSLFVTIDKSGGVNHLSNGEVSKEAWSATGKYIAGIANQHLVIWSSALEQLASVPTIGVTNLVWLDDNTLLYSASNNIWAYRLDTGRSDLVNTAGSNTGLDQTIITLALSQDRSYLYFLSELDQGTTTGYQLDRIGLHNQPTPNLTTAEQLQVFLPYTSNECSFGYLNFVKLSIRVSGPSVSEQDCLSQAASYLQNDNINTADLQFNYTSGS